MTRRHLPQLSGSFLTARGRRCNPDEVGAGTLAANMDLRADLNQHNRL